MLKYLYTSLFCVAVVMLCSCRNNEKTYSNTQANIGTDIFDLDRITDTGELIMLTCYGSDSYYEYRGNRFGRQYLLASAFATYIGTSLRVEVCRSEDELTERLENGEGDIIAYNLSDSIREQSTQLNIISSDTIIKAWGVSKQTPELSEVLSSWVRDNKERLVELSTIRIRTAKGKTYTPRRRTYAPIRNLARGEISVYDKLFRQYSGICNWDWRLLAAQAYQESAFDPQAVSYMGAMGLMQLMPSTAKDMGVSLDDVFNPEQNVRGAVRLINRLDSHYADIHDRDERINFILAAYNAGPGHVDDARILARKYGKHPNVWSGNVDGIVLRMSEPRFYNQPEVSHGFFRGSETYNYVNSIRSRWNTYREKIR